MNRHTNTLPLITLALLLALALAITACQPAPTAQPGPGQPSAEQGPDKQEPNEQPPAGASGEPTAVLGQESAAPTAEQPAPPTGGPGSFNLEDTSTGLDTLASYRQSVTLAFDGTVAGQETHSKTVVRRAVTTDPASQVTWVEIDGAPAQMHAVLGEVAYRQTGEDGLCSALNALPAETAEPQQAFSPQTLPTLVGAEDAGEETVNGIAAKHYTFDERALGLTDGAKAVGEVWVAAEGGYIVKYTLRLEGAADQLGPGVEGVQTWEYQLSDPNALTAPDLPAGCTSWQSAQAAPLPPEAVDVVRLPGFIEFSAPLSVEQVAAFYQGQAESLAWTAVDSTPVQGETVLNFRGAEGGLVSIRIQPQAEGTKTSVQWLAKVE